MGTSPVADPNLSGDSPWMTMTDSELKSKCFSILAEQVGSVEMERFVMLLSRDTFDYTEWRKDNLCPNETVDSLYDKIKSYSASCREQALA